MPKPDIHIPGRQQISGTEAINMILQQLNQFAMEFNIVNMRIQTLQNVLIAKKLLEVPELEAEWNKIMEQAKSMAARAKLVTPNGQHIIPDGPQGAEPAPQAPAPEENPMSPEMKAQLAEMKAAPADGTGPKGTEVTISPEPTGAQVVGGK